MADTIPLAELSQGEILDARKIQRIACRGPVLLQTSDGWEFAATCTDVGLGGIGVDSERVLAVGQRLNLIIDEVENPLMLVLYRTGNHYGLSALTSSERLLELLPFQS